MSPKTACPSIEGFLAVIVLLLAFRKLVLSCDSDEWTCDSGQCIAAEDLCDGAANCSDGSDEITMVCAANACALNSFKCSYGACVPGISKCNGVKDCADNSDENPILCGRGSALRNGFSDNICIAPTIRKSILRYEANRSLIIQANAAIENGATIVYACKPGYSLEGASQNVCLNSQWVEISQPICTKYCPPLNGVTYEAACKYGPLHVSCTTQVKPDTRAIIRCRRKYRKKSQADVHRVLKCLENGTWDSTPMSCEQICGEIPVRSQAFIAHANSNGSDVYEVPWHVGIYNNFAQSYRHICGGSIISAKVVISAAHCFWDGANLKLYKSSHFAIAAGKYYRDYYRHEKQAQCRNISRIHIPDEFQGEIGQFKSDIAVVILDDYLQFNRFISAVCIEWTESIRSGIYGQVSGWGKTENGTYSEVLRTADLPATNFADCKSEAGRYSDAVHDDNFCIFNKFGTVVCQGDSGGGFAVRQRVSGDRYYLWGVVNRAVPHGRVCPEVSFVIYTNVQHHRKLIMENEVSNRPDEPASVGTDLRVTGCTTPAIENAILLLNKGDTSRVINPGTKVSNGTLIQYTCERGYTLLGIEFNLCYSHRWSISVHPVCRPFCPPMQEVTFFSSCEYKGERVPCENIKSGTEALVVCQDGYRSKGNLSTHLKCLNSGEWNKPPHVCEPICGEILLKTPMLHEVSIPSNERPVPWHVHIYIKTSKGYTYRCAGTIVSPKVIISAANCFWNAKQEKFRDKSEYVVAAGNYFRDYHEYINAREAQVRNISKIVVPDGFQAVGDYFRDDIAVIVLDDFLKFNAFILPACIDWKKGAGKWIESGVRGIITGWGNKVRQARGESVSSSPLKVTSSAECKFEFNDNPNINEETFCILSQSELIPCQIEAGGGYAAVQRISRKDVYYLWGVFSVGGRCYAPQEKYISVYTNIQFYRDLIERNIEHNLPKQGLQ